MSIIVIDPGHSGVMEPGAVNHELGLTEANITLSASRRVQEVLQMKFGHSVHLTRVGDIDNDELTWRGQRANELNADLLVSIHCNAAENKSAEGFEAFTTPGVTRSDKAAEYILEAIEEAFPELSARYDLVDGDKDKEARFTVITTPDCPAVLLEIGFISNNEEALKMNDPVFQQRYAEAIASGINRFIME